MRRATGAILVSLGLGFAIHGLLGVEAARAAPLVLFIAGQPSHGPGEHRFPDGCDLLAGSLSACGLGVRAEVNRGWPGQAELTAAQVLVVYSDGLEAHVAKDGVADLRRHVEEGRGLVVLHFALEPLPGELAEFLLEAVGGRFDPEWSVNPIWTVEDPLLAAHAVTRGVVPFRIEDEWYYHLRFRSGVVPVLQAVPPASSLGVDGLRTGNPAVRAAMARGDPQTLAWVFEGEGHRAFGFTGGHFHANWSNDALRTLVLNGIVWTAGIEVPDGGVASVVAPVPRYATIDEAIARGDLDDVRRHVSVDPGRVHRGRHATMTPLHQAILRGRTAIAVFLLDSGADPNEPDASARTPLHLAVERGSVDAVHALLEKLAKPDLRDGTGWTPLHHAAARDRVDLAEALLAGGADPMTLSELGGTPLHEAAASGGAEMVRLLLHHGVDPGVVSSQGVTALDIARQYGNDAAIEALTGGR